MVIVPTTGAALKPQQGVDYGEKTIVWISDEVYEDMGKPKFVTVTIEPGDHLNSG
jgi:hypothetical protein